MADMIDRKYCPGCRQHTKFVKRRCPHLVHFIITLLVVGLWLPVWILHAIKRSSEPWRCDHCGSLPGREPKPYTANFNESASLKGSGTRVLTEADINNI